MASVPKVIYASRTHSQLSQVVRELKTLRENGYDINMSVLGGRGGMRFEIMIHNPENYNYYTHFPTDVTMSYNQKNVPDVIRIFQLAIL